MAAIGIQATRRPTRKARRGPGRMVARNTTQARNAAARRPSVGPWGMVDSRKETRAAR